MKSSQNLQSPIILDGAMGTLLWRMGWRKDKLPCLASLKAPYLVSEIHQNYIQAGSRFLLANTFGANSLQFSYRAMNAINKEGVRLAKEAARSCQAHVAAPIAPVHAKKKLKKPETVQLYAEQITAIQEAGPDAILFETFIQPADMEAALDAAARIARLPVIFSISAPKESLNLKGIAFLKRQKLPQAVIALGVNCVSPPQALKMLERIKKFSALPLWAKPHAGLPDKKGAYPIKPKTFAGWGSKFAKIGVHYMGGCCGTTPEMIKALKNLPPLRQRG